MAGISQHCKTGDVLSFGQCVGVASKALCGLTEAAGQVRSQPGTVTHWTSFSLCTVLADTQPVPLQLSFTVHFLSTAMAKSIGSDIKVGCFMLCL